MKKAILIDGNNLVFRSYYATAYTGSLMKNSKGFPTNALYGFVNMINKILNEEKPEYIMVAFDIGKNFRHDLYKNYKEGRIETPKELLEQFPVSKKILTAMGIKYVEVENYEADDIIGTFARMADEDGNFDATIVSSDRDLLQLISSDVDVKLLKQKDYIRLNEQSFFEEYGIKPIQIIDLKALEGDKSDNIPGVKGIGEKGAIKLIQEFGTIENIYGNIDQITGATQKKLIEDKENAFFSKNLATIFKNVPINLTFEDIIKVSENTEELNKMYEELEFYSFLKNRNISEERQKLDILNIVPENINDYAFYLELDGTNYHIANIIGLGIYDGENAYYLDEKSIKENSRIFENTNFTYDVKKARVTLNKINISLKNSTFDTMIAAYLLNYNVKDDIAYLSNSLGYNLPFYESIVGKKKTLTDEEVKEVICHKAKFIYETREKYTEELKKEELLELFNTIEMPLIEVLSSMEIEGVKVDKTILDSIKEETLIKINNISNQIYNYAGESFIISSPKQLAEILFEKLALPTHQKKSGKNGYSTSHDIISKLRGVHPIIESILEFRNLNKLYTTYLDPLKEYVLEDGKIHTIYKQTIARTGRLSSIEPNLQNIPIRSDEGRKIRKAFISSKDIMLDADYSQIELRVLAHVSECKELIDAFIQGEDIHTKVAADIHGVPIEQVSKNMRSTAKAVIFGIVYGISGFGLSENLDLPYNEAKRFIDKYLTLYPGVKIYMDNIVLEAKSRGYVRTLMNRKRTIEELNNPSYIIRQQGERIALNTPIQGTSADIIKKAMIDVYNEMIKRNLKSKLILQVHDELVFDLVEEEKEEMIELVKNIMENTYKLVVPLEVDIDLGSNWYDAK